MVNPNKNDTVLVLMLVLLSTLCGDRGYRPLADFSHQHWPSLCALLDVLTLPRW